MTGKFLALLLLAHCTQRGDLSAPCDAPTLQKIATDCRAKVRAECSRSDAGVVDPNCATLIDCNKRVDAWHACAGSGGGAQ
jgi:hypothetical protein